MHAEHDDSLFDLRRQSGPIEGMTVGMPPLVHDLVGHWPIKWRKLSFEETHKRYELVPRPYLHRFLHDLSLFASTLRDHRATDGEDRVGAEVKEAHAKLEVAVDVGESIRVRGVSRLAYVDGDVEVCGGLEAVLQRRFADLMEEWVMNGGRILPCVWREVDAETHFDVKLRH